MKDKNIVRTYRNGKSVYQQTYVIRLKQDVAKTKYLVTEQRATFKDEKIIFQGEQKAAEKFYTETVSVIINS